MDATLLCNLQTASRDAALRLRLLHMWLAKPPNSPTVYYHCCLWVDQTGMLIQAIADTTMAADINRSLCVGTIYIIKEFGLNTARNLYRACSFVLTMNITRTTTFQECTLPALDFPTDSFEILPFSELPSRSGFHRILTDVIGRLHSISGIDHQLTNSGSTPKQTLVLDDGKGHRISITLWNKLAGSLDRAALIQADAIEPVIIAVGSLMVGRQIGSDYTCSSSSVTRITVNPRIPEAYHLTNVFGGPRNPVTELPVQFATPVDALIDAENRAKTLAELLDLHHRGASADAKHFCSGTIKSIDSRTPWYYTSCNMCRKSCSPCEDASYWCPKHWKISENQVTIGYKIQLILRDNTGEASFIVFGSYANNLVFTSTPLLAQRFPHRSGQLPPELDALYGKHVKFETKLPMVEANGVTTGEFRVIRVVPQQNHHHQIQAAAPLLIQNTMHASQPSQTNNCQSGALVGAAAVKLSLGPGSGSYPSSSSKGKEKVSGHLLLGNCKPAFQIGQLMREPLSQSHESVSANERITSSGVDVVPKEHSTLQTVVPLDIISALQETNEPPTSGPGKLITTDVVVPKQPISDKTIDMVNYLVTPSQQLENKNLELMSSPGHVSSNLSGSVLINSETPQSKIGAPPLPNLPFSSSTPPFSSPSASMLVSPLAKVKVEKLDASELKKNEAGAPGSGSFSIGNSDSAEEGSGRPSVKHRLY